MGPRRMGSLIWMQLLLWTRLTSTDVNVARGKPTFASSVYCDSTGPCGSSYFGSQLAVDGNYDTNMLHYSCFSTNEGSGGPNYWAVDMGLLVFVDHVTVTNRGGSDMAGCSMCLEKLDNFTVGLTNVTPSVSTVSIGSYPICGIYPGRVPIGATVSVQCAPGSPSARYVIVQQPETGPGYLTLCEAEVWTSHTRAQWKRQSDYRLENYVNSTVYVGRALDCMVLCQESKDGCDSFNHCPIDNACELNIHPYGFNSSSLVANSTWNFWTTYY